MSTSPSWFDQEKFSRLVKKVGTTTRPGGAPSASPSPSAPDPVQLPPASTSAAEAPGLSTISTIPKPAPGLSLFTYDEATPAAAPQTTSAPAAKALPSELSTEKAESAADFHVSEQPHVSKKPGHTATSALQSLSRSSKPLAPPVPGSTLLRRTSTLPGIKPLTEPFQPIERTTAPIRIADVLGAFTEPTLPLADSGSAETFEIWESRIVLSDAMASYKEQITQLNQERDNLAAKVAEFSLVAQERDNLAAKVAEFSLVAQERDNLVAKVAEFSVAAQERDEARFEAATLRHQLAAAQEQNIATLQSGDGIETLKQEIKRLHEQVALAKDEASTAQRGLVLSQKALQETRDALREAADVKDALENLKKERSTLVQQNMMLQAQNDQVARQLSALKAKISQ